MIQRKRQILTAVILAAVLFQTGSVRLYAAGSGNRTLSFYNIHNKERLTVQYKKNGKFIPAAMKKINWILRDWRRNEPTKMDPKLIDLVWQIHQELGSQKPVHIISGYRSRKTNNMLRRTRGGQAKRSQHILGKAMDVYFPDVPLKKLRYSALVREQGGVGYYPTSGIPFVHIDTGRVRHWPRLPRYELALLFPDAKTRHRPARGGPITRKDVRIAKQKHRRLAIQIASLLEHRKRGTGKTAPAIIAAPAGPVVASRTSGWRPRVIAAAKPPAPRRQIASVTIPPALVSAPKLVRRADALPPVKYVSQADRERLTALLRRPASHTTTPGAVSGPSPTDRKGLAKLALAALNYRPRLVAPPRLAQRTPLSARPTTRLASLGSTVPRGALDHLTNAPAAGHNDPSTARDDWQGSWVQAPAYDEEHPDEMSYRPFPVAPLLTASVSADDPALAHMTHPDALRTLDLLDGIDSIPPLQFRPGRQIARLLMAQRFTGNAVDLSSLYGGGQHTTGSANDSGRGLRPRRVITSGG